MSKKNNLKCFRCEYFIFNDSVGICKLGNLKSGGCNKFKEIGICLYCGKKISTRKQFCGQRCYDLWKRDWEKGKKIVLNICPKCSSKLVRPEYRSKAFRRCEKCGRYFTFSKLIKWNKERNEK